jgi:hypothetical protein
MAYTGGPRPKLRMTPVQVRDHARTFIMQFDGNERPVRAFRFIQYFCDNNEYRVGITQIRAALRGLEQGMNRGAL